MNNRFISNFRKRQDKESASGFKSEKTIPPHIVACKVCGGHGRIDGNICPQCHGSGRVVISCEVVKHISAYIPGNNLEE